jgi:hypothetical protein
MSIFEAGQILLGELQLGGLQPASNIEITMEVDFDQVTVTAIEPNSYVMKKQL